MALKQYKPTSPSRRGLILVDKSALWKGKPVKALTEGKRKTGGRNNKGHVTSRGPARSSAGRKAAVRRVTAIAALRSSSAAARLMAPAFAISIPR